jgi:hypothetical protein
MKRMRFKGKGYIDNSAFFVCWEIDCKEESTRIWANSQGPVIDLCDFHYNQAIYEQGM